MFKIYLYTYFSIILVNYTIGQIAQTENGQIRGSTKRSRNGRSYSEFLGIPYAKPPIDDLRWRDPVRIENWSGVLSTRQFKSECTQIEILVTGRLQGSEDCLYLNVFTPKLDARGNDLIPVMVYVHGGLFMGGSSNLYRGKYFMDEDIVLVTMNYRLGALGFLSTNDSEVRGNMGLKDQNLVLQWVQGNIENFGGNKNRVTLFGESAGGASVHYHLFSPLSSGLFHRAISQSGSAIRTYVSTNNLQGQAHALGARFGCNFKSEETQRLINCLRKIDARKIVSIDHKALAQNYGEYALYAPVIETIIDERTFLPAHPRDLVQSGNYHKIPWMVGVNDAEGLLYVGKILADKSLTQRIDKDWEFLAPYLLNYPTSRQNGSEIYPEIAQKVRDFYFKGQKSLLEPLENFTAMFTDLLFALPLRNAAILQSKHSPVYLYYYNYKSQISVFDLIRAVQVGSPFPPELQIAQSFVTRFLRRNILRRNVTHYGACHGDELSLQFNTNPFSLITPYSTDFKMSQELIKTWTQFAYDETQMTFDGKPVERLQFSPNGSPKYFNFNLPTNGIINEDFTQRIQFWEEINPQYINNNFFLIYFQGHKYIK